MFQGIRPAVVALIAVPVISMGKTAKVNKKNFIIPLLAAVLVAVFKITPNICNFGCCSYRGYRCFKEKIIC